MNILPRTKILERLQQGTLKFSPALDSFQLRPHAVDLRLGYTFMVPKSWHMTPQGREALSMDHFDKERPQYFDVVELEEKQYFDLLPGEYIIVSALEKITIPQDIVAFLYPRSSVNRKGLTVDLTGVVDCGYEGNLVIPVRNNTAHQVVRLYPGERFCQLIFQDIGESIESVESSYKNKDIIEGAARANPETGEKGEEEITLIQQGDIKTLKSKYAVDIQGKTA